MGDTQQTQPAGTGSPGAEAAAELAEIQQRQGHVIRAVLVPVWYWWAMAAAMIAIGAARDSHDGVVLAIIVPLAVLVMVLATGAMIPQVRRRVQVQSAVQPGASGGAAIFGLIVLVSVVTIAAASSLTANRVSYPLTTGFAAGAAVLVIGGPLVNRYLRTLMLSRARREMNDAPQAGGTP
jgi:hypothetical protein